MTRLVPLLILALLGNRTPAEDLPGLAGNSVSPLGEPVLEAPTLHSLGIHWITAGDANGNATIGTEWRTPGGKWQKGAPLLRVESGTHKPEKGKGSVEVPDGATLYAGSVLLLEPDTEYEVKLSLTDPDGGSREATLKARTLTEPKAPEDLTVFHVAPGSGGGSGSAADPFRGLTAAHARAHPGALFLLHAGKYSPFVVTKSGEPGRPIVWQSAEDGEAMIDGSEMAEREGRLISADHVHDVWFEGLTIRNGGKGLAGNGSARIVVRNCHINGVTYGIFATRNEEDTMRGWFVADNVISGPSTWPRTKGIEDARGIQLTGEGHVVCYNRIHGFGDAIDTFPSPRCADIDFHNNEISGMTDDGAELDYSERNVRCFSNRFTDVYQGISTQPVFGGPVYVFRNALYNVVGEPFKMHNSPSGALFFHNTVVKKGMPLFIYTGAPVRHCWTRNNLFIGTPGGFAFESTAPMNGCDFDYDGVGGGPWNQFVKWNGVRYPSLEKVKEAAVVWHHAVVVDAATAFASGASAPDDPKATHQPVDLRLKSGSGTIDTGEPLPGFNDSFADRAPDLGAYEAGSALPHYGPRPQKPRSAR